VLLIAITAAAAQTRHDPLNAREVEQMRDSAQDPKKRVELVLSFASERMLAIERLRTAAKPGANDPATIASLLADLAGLIDELDDNLDMYNRHSEDLRNPLRHVLDAEAEFQKKLAELGESATAQQKRLFAAALEDATDSIKTSSESTRAMLADQIAKKGEVKSKDKASRSPSSSPARPGNGQQAPDPTGMGGVGSRPPEE
jgi:hypothetical protein